MRILRLTAITLVTLFFSLPILWLFAAAFKTNIQVTDPSVGLFFDPTLANFQAIFKDGEILRSLLNSVIVGVVSTALAAPGTATACLLAFVSSWNNFMFALIFSNEDTKTAPVALFNFISYASTDWGGLMAAATLMTLPVVLAAILGQKYIVSGLTKGIS
ncbi:hypothetical protein LWC34_15440 [Kibdelosporangium philippinense]|uniref:Multiple sugar transport system permease protein n=1 Tax=Kibdelosporangium philippinense TaxID=211113 RepID=A0ABS8ZCG3_9PSEU|nr:hypothetical protein [Kibdelosporangium philippinense]MCE7004218.1 hypothetical protein [Kibdelosporangium philippinense]